MLSVKELSVKELEQHIIAKQMKQKTLTFTYLR